MHTYQFSAAFFIIKKIMRNKEIEANLPEFSKTQNVRFEFFTSKHISSFAICSTHCWALYHKKEIDIQMYM